jgi:hypothetical protein
MLGWENSRPLLASCADVEARPLPACMYNEIRKRYPSQTNTGYK